MLSQINSTSTIIRWTQRKKSLNPIAVDLKVLLLNFYFFFAVVNISGQDCDLVTAIKIHLKDWMLSLNNSDVLLLI